MSRLELFLALHYSFQVSICLEFLYPSLHINLSASFDFKCISNECAGDEVVHESRPDSEAFLTEGSPLLWEAPFTVP